MTSPSLAIILLASGLSHRFENGDKLFAKLGDDLTVLEKTNLSLSGVNAMYRFAVVGSEQMARADFLKRSDWQILTNHNPEGGLSGSVALGIKAAREASVDQVLFALADMPFIPSEHYTRLIQRIAEGYDVVFSASTTLHPPAIFAASTFDAILNLKGDKGLKSAVPTTAKQAQILLSDRYAIDIDTIKDLELAVQLNQTVRKTIT